MHTKRFSTGRTSWVYKFYKPKFALFSFGLLATRSISLPWLRAYVNDKPQTKLVVCLSLAVVYCIGAAALRPYRDNRWLAADVATAVISVGLVAIAAVASPETNTIAAEATPGQEFGMWTLVAVVLLLLLFCLVTWAKGLTDQLPKMTDIYPTFRKPGGLSKTSSLVAETCKVGKLPDAAAAEDEGQQVDPNLDLDGDILDADEATSEASRRFPGASIAAPSDASSQLQNQTLAAALAEGRASRASASPDSQTFGTRAARRELELAVRSWSTGEPETSAAGTEQPMSEDSRVGLASTVKRTIGNIAKPSGHSGRSGSSSGSGDGGSSLPMDADLSLYPDAETVVPGDSDNAEPEAVGPWSSKMLMAFKKPGTVSVSPTFTSPEQASFIDVDVGMDIFRGYVSTGSGPVAAALAIQGTTHSATGSKAEVEAEAVEGEQQYKWV